MTLNGPDGFGVASGLDLGPLMEYLTPHLVVSLGLSVLCHSGHVGTAGSASSAVPSERWGPDGSSHRPLGTRETLLCVWR